MNQRDYLEIQIEQLGKVLKAMLNQILGAKDGNSNSEMSTLSEQLITEVDFDFNNAKTLSDDDLNAIVSKSNWSRQNEDLMIKIWIAKAAESADLEKQKHLEMATKWLDAFERKDDIISFERIGLREKISLLGNGN